MKVLQCTNGGVESKTLDLALSFISLLLLLFISCIMCSVVISGFGFLV